MLVALLDRRAVGEEIENCGVPALPADADARCSHLRRGWYWGGQAFAERLRKLAGQVAAQRTPRSRQNRRARELVAHDEAQAAEWLREGLKAAGLRAADLQGTPGSDPMKLALAELLWKHTTVGQGWIAEHLAMRSAANVSQQLRRLDRTKLLQQLPPALKSFLQQARTT